MDAFDHIDDVCAGLALDIQNDGRSRVVPGLEFGVFRRALDRRDIGETDRGAGLVGDDQVLVFLRRLELVIGIDRESARRPVEITLAVLTFPLLTVVRMSSRLRP